MLSAGDRAPSFSLPDDTGRTVTLASLKGRTVVLYFYPKDDTPGCTTQACGLRDNWAALEQAGAVVLGVSPDSPARHAAFRAKYDLPFALLADEDHAVAERYGAWGEKSMYGKKYFGILRTTYIIDGTGVVRHVFEKVKPKGHAGQVLDVLTA
ncbi:MAG: thioredoxin-dependent thiol peroxidase [Gemmatimonadetes bacterium]|nr:thioredoxin-dependent thiol peroxidase [Gemmatimonadota bacterium]MCB9504563.1 thioredoxin-dependent thiol peroxidase [Gemmatimonadales bacterium]MCA9761714.1 thioredoxin-dependent thiol peroxidase [Gemmatimonadota bacterium]MCA9768092.1 thioredoxin-dependent thiol peroxidase [Gemmatimonadota bacterium]MCB9518136.1 thioredoxin-dependent thiol peroxidase [Gemmatimonadales bacterium]